VVTTETADMFKQMATGWKKVKRERTVSTHQSKPKKLKKSKKNNK
jgi:hypothetical protein